MTELLDDARHTTPLSLYIALQPGSRADMEVVGRAAIAWSQIVREAALLIDPFMEVRVELVSGTEGSLNLNSIVNAVRSTLSNPAQLKAIALGIAAYFSAQAGGWFVGKGYDQLWAAAQEQMGISTPLSEAERQEVEKIISQIIESDSTKKKAGQVYYELSRDPAVAGVGVSLIPETRPPNIVPRAEFDARSGKAEITEEVVKRRTEQNRLTLTLVAPVLAEGEYKWRFQLGSKTFWAFMRDDKFRARIAPDSRSAPRMVSGIQIDADVTVTQELRDNVWTNVSQEVTKVHSLREPPSQPSWLDAPSQD